jgi:IS30 family transposase
MIHMYVPKTFWSHGVLSAAYVINRLPSRILHFKSPLKVLQKQPPNLSHL